MPGIATTLHNVRERVYAIVMGCASRVSPWGAEILRKTLNRIASSIPLMRSPHVLSAAQDAAFHRAWRGELRLPPVTGTPRITLIIPVFNQISYTTFCLDALASQPTQASFEVLVIDDCSTDKTPQILSRVANLRVHRNATNLGFLRSANAGAALARGEYLLLLNNDTRPQPGWIDALLNVFLQRADAGLVGARLIYPDGRLQEAGGIVWADGSAWNYGNSDDPRKSDYNYLKESDYISGAAIMIPRNLWQQLNGFSEEFLPAYCEDTDLAYRVRQAGYKVILQPKATVIHFEGISHGRDLRRGIKKHQVTNLIRFREKWNEVLQREQQPPGEHLYWARDRSRGRRSILVIDYQVPAYDREAGGRSAFQYICLFQQAGLHVTFLPHDACRPEPYTSTLENLGIEVIGGGTSTSAGTDWITRNGRYLDYVFLNRPDVAQNYVDLLRRESTARLLFYGHDLHHIRLRRQYETTGDEESLKLSLEYQKIEDRMIRSVDVSYYPSEMEVELLKQTYADRDIRRLPLMICEEQENRQYPGYDARQGLLFVGGFRHPPNGDGINWFVKEVLPLLREKLPLVEVFVVGSSPSPQILGLDSPSMHIVGYVPDEELVRYYNRCRLAIVPLRFGAGAKGKVIEALDCSLPVVSTRMGAEGLPEIESVLRIGDTAEEFAARVIEVYSSATLWDSLVRAGHDYLRKYFTVACAKAAFCPHIDWPSVSSSSGRRS